MPNRWIPCAALTGLLACACLASDWPQYGGAERNFRLGAQLPETLHIAWKRPLDVATSGILVHEDILYTQVATNQPKEGQNDFQEGFVAMRRSDGKTLWRTDYPTRRHGEQQTFGASVPQPQATPALVEGTLVGLGFGGMLSGVDARDGKLLWQHDLVAQHKAPPVQFGFASSPVAYRGKVYVLAGGDTGLLCLEPRSGKVVWKKSCAASSYATPILLRVGQDTHLVVLTKQALLGVDPKDGTERWRYALPKPGMTDVPTPLDAGNGRVVVAGQGLGGTRLLQVERDETAFRVREVWHNRKANFFYNNWLIHAGHIYGSDGGFLNVLRLDNGIACWRSRGAQEANLVAVGNEALVVHGENGLSRWSLAGVDSHITWHATPELGRCWTPPTIVDDEVFVRSETTLYSLQRASATSQAITEVKWDQQPRRDTRTSVDRTSASRLQQIQAAFQEGGAEFAWQTYLSIHENNPKDLAVPERLELVDMALGEGLTDAAAQILQHTNEVYPSNADVRAALKRMQERSAD